MTPVPVTLKTSFQRTLTFPLTLCDSLFCSSAWLDWELSYPFINETHLWVHLWGHFHRFNREGTIHPECQQCHLVTWGLGPNEGVEERRRKPADASISSLSLLLLLLHHFPLDYLGISQSAPHHPYFPLFPCPPPYGLPSKKCWGKKMPHFCCHIVTLAWSQGSVP